MQYVVYERKRGNTVAIQVCGFKQAMDLIISGGPKRARWCEAVQQTALSVHPKHKPT